MSLSSVSLEGPAGRAESPRSVRTTIFSGRDDVLGQAELLEELAGKTGQSGSMHGLDFLVKDAYWARKIPHLVCLFADDGTLAGGDASMLIGAALFFEYRLAGIRTGMVATGDSFGVRTVIGQAEMRSRIATMACASMLERGTRVVLATYKSESPPVVGASAAGGCWAVAVREVQDRLLLASSLEETLARMGKRTRTHFRYYRKRFEETQDFDFVADAATQLRLDDPAFLAALNRGSLNPIAQGTFDLQARSTASLRGGYVSGLRARGGQWMALAGGWRQNDTTWVQWQMNAVGYERCSLGTVLRSYVIEHESARGQRQLCFHGGTSHSMVHSFVSDTVVDLLARRSGWFPALLVRVVPRLYAVFPKLTDRGNFLGEALSRRDLVWWGDGGEDRL